MTNNHAVKATQSQFNPHELTYFDCVALSSKWFLHGKKELTSTFLSGFRSVAGGWCDLPVTQETPIASGIDRDGYPVELSVTQKQGEIVALRWLAQAGSIDQADQTPEIFHRLVQNLPPVAGTKRWRSLLQELIDCDIDTTKSYFAWFGLEASLNLAQSPTPKIYINPWAIQRLSCSEVIALIATEVCGRPRSRQALAMLTDAFDTARPLIIGVNFRPGDMPPEAKLYFVAHLENSSELLQRLDQLDPILSARFRALFSDKLEVREVHIALSLDSLEGARLFKVNLFMGGQNLGHARGSLSSVLNLLQNSQIVPVLEPDHCDSVEVINFIGLDSNKLDVYYRPWR